MRQATSESRGPQNPRSGGKGSVFFIGNSYYNNWYLAQALQKRNWQAETITYPGEAADLYLHGYDHMIDHEQSVITSWQQARLEKRVAGLKLSLETVEELSRRATTGGPQDREHLQRQISKLKLETDQVLRSAGNGRHRVLEPLFRAVREADILHFTGLYNLRFFYFFNLALFGHLPIEWDIRLLRLLGKKIVYSNTLCLDGVAQSSLSRLGPPSVCEFCRYKDEPALCSDEGNLNWGRVRNALTDYHVLLGGNHLDYNDDPQVHEVPEFYCLDPDFWHPDLEIPAKYRVSLPAETVKVYHAVGNLETRSVGEELRNIKCTHIYIPLIERLKDEGHSVELIFCNDVPNKEVRFYQAQADIVVDMLAFGFFGANVREAMMLGKPVICYLRPEWLTNMRREIPQYVDELPVISATPDTVYHVLRELVQNSRRREEIGRRSRQFALKWHSSDAAGRRFDQIYSELLADRPSTAAA